VELGEQGRRSKQLLYDHNTLWKTRLLQTSRKTISIVVIIIIIIIIIIIVIIIIISLVTSLFFLVILLNQQ